MFRIELSERLRTMEERLLKTNEEALRHESTNHELSRKLSEYQQRELLMMKQMNDLSQELTNTQ